MSSEATQTEASIERRGERSTAAILAVVLLYAAVASAWILFSDRLLEAAVSDPAARVLIGTVKGFGFVAVTSLLLYFGLRRFASADFSADAQPDSDWVRLRWGIVLLVLVFIASGIVVGLRAVAELKREQHRQLQSIADLKVKQIDRWIEERRRDVDAIRMSPTVSATLARQAKRPAIAAPISLNARLDAYRSALRYQAVLILDRSGDIVAHSENDGKLVWPETIDVTRRALASGQVEFSHFYIASHDGIEHRYIDFAAPFSSSSTGLAVVLRTDAREYILPYMQTWPVPSASAETLLVRREGDEIHFINSLRHQVDGATEPRFSADHPTLLAALAASGRIQHGNLIEGSDYRDVPSFGVVKPVSGTDWLLIAKIDRAEAYAKLHDELPWIAFGHLLTLLVGLALLMLLRQRRELRWAMLRNRDQSDRLRALQLLDAIAEASTDAIFVKDSAGRYLLANRATAAIMGRKADEILGRDDSELIPQQAPAIAARDREIMSGSTSITFEESVSTPHGRVIFLTTKGPLRDSAGQVFGIYGIARDITALHHAEQAMRTTSAVNQALVHATSEAELLATTCTAIVDTGGYRMVWVGYAMDNAERGVQPVASAGMAAGYLENIDVHWADDELGRGPTGTAIREQRPVAMNSIATDPAMAPWRETAKHQGFASSLALPLLGERGECLGAINIYATEANAFDGAAQVMLAELAADLAYGIRSQRDRAARDGTAALLREMSAIAHIGAWTLDVASRRVTATEEVASIHEVPPERIRQFADCLGFYAGEWRQRLEAAVKDCIDWCKPFDLTLKLVTAAGREKWLRTIGWAIKRDGKVIEVRGTFQDITERQAAAEEIRRRNEELERFNRAVIGRELDMIALKQTINDLSTELGREPPFPSAGSDAEPP